MSLQIKGFDKSDLINYSPYTAATVYLPLCNFRCPFCQNPLLVKDDPRLPVTTEEEFFSFMDRRKGWLEGVCITGGEPTLHKELPAFIRKVKEKGFHVKLDTNGTNPKMLRGLLDEGLLDYIAMDIKASFSRYGKAAGADVDISKIRESMRLMMDSKEDYEFRTTAVKELISPDDFLEIAKEISGARKYVLQQFRKSSALLDPAFTGTTYSVSELENIKEKISRHVAKAMVRGN